MEYRTLTRSCPWANLFPWGTVLWRHVEPTLAFGCSDIRVPEFIFGKTDKGTYFAKLTLQANGMWEPEVVPPEANGKKAPGIAVFCNHLPSPSFTHLIVQKTSKAMHLPGKQEVGGAVFVTEGRPYPWNEYVAWRRRIYDAYKNQSICDIEHALSISKEICINENRKGERRLVLQTAWFEDHFYDFAHI